MQNTLSVYFFNFKFLWWLLIWLKNKHCRFPEFLIRTECKTICSLKSKSPSFRQICRIREHKEKNYAVSTHVIILLKIWYLKGFQENDCSLPPFLFIHDIGKILYINRLNRVYKSCKSGNINFVLLTLIGVS